MATSCMSGQAFACSKSSGTHATRVRKPRLALVRRMHPHVPALTAQLDNHYGRVRYLFRLPDCVNCARTIISALCAHLILNSPTFLSQMVHAKGLFPECVLSWLERWLRRLNTLEQVSHVNARLGRGVSMIALGIYGGQGNETGRRWFSVRAS